MTYDPKPIDTSAVTLDEPLSRLAERLAENAHDVWAELRVKEGWRCGPARDDAEKRHPCLVPYEELPESEKEYDRRMVDQALKGMVALGYRIVPPEQPLPDTAPEHLQALALRLKAPSPMRLTELQRIWERHVPAEWRLAPDIYRLLAERIIKVGEPLLAYDVLCRGLKSFPENADFLLLAPDDRALCVRLLQLSGLALAQSGATYRAKRVLQNLYDKGLRDGETLGILARTCKDIAFNADTEAERRQYLAQAHDRYLEAFRIARAAGDSGGAFYNGINVAFLAMARGQTDDAEAMAGEVRDICEAVRQSAESDGASADYWVYATLGEANLLLRAVPEAERFYRKAARLAEGNSRDVSAMRKQARRILGYHGLNASLANEWFYVPRVLLYSGNASRNLSPEDIHSRENIAGGMDDPGAGIAYAMVANRLDILFAEEMIRRNVELNLVLPVSREEFRERIASDDSGERWPSRFDAVFEKAARVFELSCHCALGNDCNLRFAVDFTNGMARLRAHWIDTNIQDISFIDEKYNTNASIENLAIAENDGERESEPMLRECIEMPEADLVPAIDMPPNRDAPVRRIYAMMFADVKNYSRMEENQFLWFAHHFLAEILKAISPFDACIVSKRTTGDGFFIVFRTVAAALECAVAFQRTVAGIDWHAFHLPKDLEVRISLDAGPVYAYHDPIMSHTEFCGKYVIRAARIEPVTPPGEIYASESFAALATAEGISKARFEYAGQVRLAKNYGSIPVYHVRRGVG